VTERLPQKKKLAGGRHGAPGIFRGEKEGGIAVRRRGSVGGKVCAREGNNDPGHNSFFFHRLNSRGGELLQFLETRQGGCKKRKKNINRLEM